jgi:hypothetical protein
MPQQQSANEQEAALRRALIRVKPEYFSWPTEAQERYRVHMPEDDAFRIEQTVLNLLFDLQVDTKAQLRAAFDSFTPAQYLRFNSTMLPLHGIGEDYFFPNGFN